MTEELPPVYDDTPKDIQSYVDSILDNTFPNNVIELTASRFELLDRGINVVRRMPSNDDPNFTLGFVPVVLTPNPSSYEMRGTGSFVGTTFKEYLVVIYAFCKDAMRERGQASHGVLTEIVEHILETDLTLRQSLGMLQSDVMGSQKRYQRHYIRQARYLANELDGNHLFLQATEVVFEIEKVA